MYFSYNLHFLSLLYYFVSTFSIQLSSFFFFLFFIFSLTFLFLLLYFKAHDENKSMFLIILILVSYSDWIIFSFSLLRDVRQISPVILSEFKQISCLLFPRNHQIIRRNKSYLFCSNSLSFRNEIWRRSIRTK